MTKDLDDLSYLFASPDHWREFVLSGEVVEAHSEMFEIRRKLITTAIFFLFFFVAADARSYFLHHHFAVGAESSEQLYRIAVSIGEQRIKEIGRFDQSASLLARMLQCVR